MIAYPFNSQTALVRNSSFFLALLMSFGLLAQNPKDGLTGLSSVPLPQVKELKSKTAVTLNLPVSDDFSYDGTFPDSSIWMDNFVYVNNHLCSNPITKGVATFDGLNIYGHAYDIDKQFTDTADILTSHPIDLANTTDSVILSFFYQAGGLGEPPASGDSLTLHFYDSEASVWRTVWKIEGSGDTSNFKLVQIPITDTIFLKNDFQFRFMAYGSVAGSFDLWHLDYVRLRDNVRLGDSTFTDPSILSTAPSAITGYDAMPWFHYTAAPDPSVFHQSNYLMRYRKNEVAGGNITLNLAAYQINYNGAPVVPEFVGSPVLDDFHNTPNLVYSYPHSFPVYNINPSPNGEFEYDLVFTFTGTSLQGFPANDTVIRHQVFKNYYSYDDGTAERAYFVSGNDGGFIVSEYRLQAVNQDSLKGVYIYFTPSNTNVTENEFTIVVFENDNGVPGNLIYESDSVYTPSFSEHNFYLPYALDEAVEIVDRAFIGIRQSTSDLMTIGFDVNTPSRTPIFYGRENNVSQSFREGNIMMRPFFRYLPNDIGTQESVFQKLDFDIYPNPNSGVFSVEIPSINENDSFTYKLISLSGQVVKGGDLDDSTINLGSIQKGIYFLEVSSNASGFKGGVKKLIIH